MNSFEALSTTPEIRITSVLRHYMCCRSQEEESRSVYYSIRYIPANAVLHVVNLGCRNVFSYGLREASDEVPYRVVLELL